MRCLIAVLFFSVLLSGISNAQPRFEPTMEKMAVYMLQVQLVRDNGDLVTIFSGEKEINPQSANPGQVIEDIVQSAPVPPGTYTNVRVTMSRLTVMKMYLEIPGVGRVMQTTANGIEEGFRPEGPPPNTVDPSHYGELRFLMPENPDEGKGPDSMTPVASDISPSDAGTIIKEPPAGVFPTLVVEEGKTTTFTMGFGSGEPDRGYDQNGSGGDFKNPTQDSNFEATGPQ